MKKLILLILCPLLFNCSPKMECQDYENALREYAKNGKEITRLGSTYYEGMPQEEFENLANAIHAVEAKQDSLRPLVVKALENDCPFDNVGWYDPRE